MPRIRLHTIGEQEVTDAFHARYVGRHPDLTLMSFATLEEAKRPIMALWDQRAVGLSDYPEDSTDPNPIVHHDERARVDAIDALLGLHRKHRHLGARHHSEFGHDGLDACAVIRHQAPCGCDMTFVPGPAGERHPLRILAACPKHAKHRKDLHRHQAAVLADNAG